ncbi:MAG: glycosyl transferase [Halochromatium sp.]|nr:glycosyl transferase [Halochromatium sp.]
MKILFVHQNFPAQFRHLAPALVAQGHAVAALHLQDLKLSEWQGVRLWRYRVIRGTTTNIHPWVCDFETKTIRADACFRAALQLAAQGYCPDLIIAHPGWGESLFLKEVWPEARLGIYCEFFYHPRGADVGFDPEFPPADPGDVCRLRLKNLNHLMHFQIADGGLSPTQWQASTYPESFRHRINVVHDGIDTHALMPGPTDQPDLQLGQQLELGLDLKLSAKDEIITFVSRDLEPYRGFHRFMRALPRLLRERPSATVLIIGHDGVSYGAPPNPALYGQRTWRQVFTDEVRPVIKDRDWSRVHFLGRLSYAHLIEVFRRSTLHVYLTYPFVLSWSLLEAMSLGCTIVASDTPPVREVISADENGRLVDFFDTDGLVDAVCELLQDDVARMRLGQHAREFVRLHYDLHSVCLPHQLAWVDALARG